MDCLIFSALWTEIVVQAMLPCNAPPAVLHNMRRQL
jgi:hypothetical protein